MKEKNVYFTNGEARNEILFFSLQDMLYHHNHSKNLNCLFIIYKIYWRRREANLTFCCVMYDLQFCSLAVKYKNLAVKYIYLFIYFIFFLRRKFEIQDIFMKSFTYLVFYTNVVLKIVILYVRLNSVLEALCNFRSRVQDFETSKKRFWNVFRFHVRCFFWKAVNFTV